MEIPENLIEKFMRESNAIEFELEDEKNWIGVLNRNDVSAAKKFLEYEKIGEKEFLELHLSLSEGRSLMYKGEYRRCSVQIGNHVCPDWRDVQKLMDKFWENFDEMDAWKAHNEYEYIHPCEDLNGRCGRLIWLWKLIQARGIQEAFSLRFLHRYYYQTLDRYSKLGAALKKKI